MQFYQSIAICASALAAFAAAQSTEVALYNMPDTVKVGEQTTLKMKCGGTCTLTLRRGNPMDLQNVSVITTSASGNSYTWTPASDLENGSDYAIMISAGDQSNFTPLFTITGGKAAGSSSSGGSSGGSAPGSYGGASSAAPSSAAAPSTMSTAAKTAPASASNCAVTQIKDGQPQAPTGCPSSAAAAASSAAPTFTPPSNGTAAAPSGAPYTPLPGNGNAPAPSSNSTAAAPTYNAPSSPTSGSSSGSAPKSGNSAAPSSPASGAAQFGSSLALIAGAAAAFAFLN